MTKIEDKNFINMINKDLDLNRIEEENKSLKEKIKELRSNNNSYIYSALVKVQSELPIIAKNSVIYGRQKYANFAEVIRVSRPILVKYGLSVTQTFFTDPSDCTILVTRLCHVSGQYIESRLKLPEPQKTNEKTNMLQEVGKSITYLSRYSYNAIIGIATDEDTDGN